MKNQETSSHTYVTNYVCTYVRSYLTNISHTYLYNLQDFHNIQCNKNYPYGALSYFDMLCMKFFLPYILQKS